MHCINSGVLLYGNMLQHCQTSSCCDRNGLLAKHLHACLLLIDLSQVQRHCVSETLAGVRTNVNMFFFICCYVTFSSYFVVCESFRSRLYRHVAIE